MSLAVILLLCSIGRIILIGFSPRCRTYMVSGSGYLSNVRYEFHFMEWALHSIKKPPSSLILLHLPLPPSTKYISQFYIFLFCFAL